VHYYYILYIFTFNNKPYFQEEFNRQCSNNCIFAVFSYLPSSTPLLPHEILKPCDKTIVLISIPTIGVVNTKIMKEKNIFFLFVIISGSCFVILEIILLPKKFGE